MTPANRYSSRIGSIHLSEQEALWPLDSLTSEAREVRSPRLHAQFVTYSTLVAMAMDILSIAFGLFLSIMIYRACGGAWVFRDRLTLLAFAFQYSLAFALFGRINFLYSHSHSLLQVRQTAAILRVSVYSLALLSVQQLAGRVLLPGFLLCLTWSFATLSVLIQKHFTRKILARWKASHLINKKAIIVGTGSEARRLFSFLLNSPDLQLTPVAFCEEHTDGASVIYSHDYIFRDRAPVYSQCLDIELLTRLSISEIFIADPALSPKRIEEIRTMLAERAINLSFVGSVHSPFTGQPQALHLLDGLLVSSFTGGVEDRGSYDASKRIIDIVGSVLALIVSSPLWVVIALWIRVSSEGPIFFRQERIGRRGRAFRILKFRSMYITASQYARSPESMNDPRITPIGRVIRKTSLDELPQLINVLVGDMTLVGPRPEMAHVVQQYNPRQMQRLSVKQGLTGIWQLSADRKYSIHQNIEYDLYYIEHRGIFMDLAILLHTIVLP